MSSRTTEALFDRYYFGRPGYVAGTLEFHELCRRHVPTGGSVLEIGAGPPNPTTRFLAGLATVTGADVSCELLQNTDLLGGRVVFDGGILPFAEACFDSCVSNYVLEHVESPIVHFGEVARVLKPGGCYIVRTPNLYHYVTGASRFLPHSAHILLAKWSRSQGAEDHDPWRTFYRANTVTGLRRLARRAPLDVVTMRLVEKEPSYGRASPLLFYPMMMYERLVNATELLSPFRSSITAVFRKPGFPQ